jgi:hypothetical protein
LGARSFHGPVESADHYVALACRALRKYRCIAVAVALFIGMIATAQATFIQFTGGAFRVVGWKPPSQPPATGWPSIFAVYAGSGNIPAVLGVYTVEDGTLIFRPRFPFAPGMKYRAVFQPPGGARVEQTFDGPRVNMTPSTRILQVYPTSGVLPSNQLRLFMYFSAPMSRGEAFQHIHLLDDHGKVLRDIFLPDEELWGRRNQELTITFDPGRIKRGLTSNEKMGPPIENGKRYTLVIDSHWQDARGVPLAAGFRKAFRGGSPIRTAPDPKTWRMIAPEARTTTALVLDFPEPMNYPLLRRMLRVSGDRGDIIGGVTIERHETEWRFTPRQPWRPGCYNLVVNTALEDLAGNHVGQLFDIDRSKRVARQITADTISLPFAVR